MIAASTGMVMHGMADRPGAVNDDHAFETSEVSDGSHP